MTSNAGIRTIQIYILHLEEFNLSSKKHQSHEEKKVLYIPNFYNEN